MGARSLATQRVAIEVAGHNLANINTPNAARQRVNILQDIGIPMTPTGTQGLGSYAESIQSVRSLLLDKQVVRQESLSGFYEYRQQLSDLVEDTLGENFTTTQTDAVEGTDSLTGVQKSLNAMFDAWQALADNPTSTVLREQVVFKSNTVGSDIRNIYSRLVDTREGVFESTAALTREANALSTEIASLNGEIARVEVVTTKPANDLRDRRQELVEQLASIVNISVTTDPINDKLLNIALADDLNIQLVDGTFGAGAGDGAHTSYSLSVDAAYDPVTNNSLLIRATPNAGPAVVLGNTQPTEGKLGAYVHAANTLIGAGNAAGNNTLIEQLNTLAGNIRAAINAQHALGSDIYGNAPVNPFFSVPAGAEALGLSVHSDYANNSRLIAAADGTLPGANPLDNTNAKALALLRDDVDITSYHRDIVAQLGTEIQQANRDHEAQKLISTQLLQQREAVSGISTDEEMTNLIQFQRAYEASARFVGIVDQLMQTVVNMAR